GVPVRAILLGTVAAWGAVVASYVSPDAVFTFLMNSIGVTLAFVYLAIAVSQLRLRRLLEREDPAALAYKMWLHPYLMWLVIAALVVVLVSMAFMPERRTQLLASLLSLAVVAAIYPLRRRYGRIPPAHGPSSPVPTADRP
ncbi:GABA permease, partial [Actinomadura adrarensis]